jgi:hypothetical protein
MERAAADLLGIVAIGARDSQAVARPRRVAARPLSSAR